MFEIKLLNEQYFCPDVPNLLLARVFFSVVGLITLGGHENHAPAGNGPRGGVFCKRRARERYVSDNR